MRPMLVPVRKIDPQTGVIGSLRRMLPDQFVTVATPTTPVALGQVTTRAMQISADAVATLGYDDVFTISTGAQEYYYWVEVAAVIPQLTEVLPSIEPTGPNLVQGQVLGVGLRLMIQATNVSASASASVSKVAAATKLQGATTKAVADLYGLTGVGDPLAAPLTALASITTFDQSTLQGLGQAVAALQAILADPDQAAKLKPQPMYIALAPDAFSYTGWTTSVVFAWNRIINPKNYTLAQTLQSEPTNQIPQEFTFQPILVEAAYTEVGLPPGEANTKPSGVEVSLAWMGLNPSYHN